ncbi:MAG: dimethylarginine dimethylaminohydrolase family protein [Acidimicrobiales bacterium]
MESAGLTSSFELRRSGGARLVLAPSARLFVTVVSRRYRWAVIGRSDVVEGERRRETVPFRVLRADGTAIELSYSSPRSAADHDEAALLETLPWFDHGEALHNWMLHDTDFYDEVEAIWGRRWGAEGIGRLREVLVSRPTDNEIRPEYSQEWQYYYSTASGTADLGRLRAQFDDYYQVLADNGVIVNFVEPPVPAIGAYGYLKNLVTLAGGGLVAHGGAIIHRMGLGSWQRGREVIWTKALAALGVPIYLTVHGRGVGEPGAGRWLDSKTFVFNNSVVANEEGLRQIEFVLNGLGIDMITAYSPGWMRTTGHGNVGTTHADMFLMVPDQGIAVLAPQLVDYAFVRELYRRDVRIIEVPVEEYWDLAVNAVTLEAGRVVMNAGSPATLKELEAAGVEVIQVDFSESHKFAIAGLHCATLELVRDQPGPLLS